MNMSNVEKEVLKALGQKVQGKKEDRQAFLKRLIVVADKLWYARDSKGEDIEPTKEASELWEGLTEPTQQWINEAVLLVDTDKEIPDFPDSQPKDEEKDQNMTSKSEGEETARKSTKTKSTKADKPAAKKTAAKGEKAPAKKAAAKADKAPAKKSTGKRARPNGVSGYTMIRSIMMKDTNTKLPDLIGQLEKKGYHLSKNATSVIRNNFLSTIAELHEAGCLRNLKLPA